MCCVGLGAGCSRPATEEAQQVRVPADEPGSADEYRRQAQMLAQALDRTAVSTLSNAPRGLVEPALEGPEEGPWPGSAGLMTCRIISIEMTPVAVIADRIQVFTGLDADERAAQDGAPSPPDGVYVRDLVAERIRVPLADDFVFVAYAQSVPEGLSVLDYSGGFPIVVLDRAGFLAQYRQWLDEMVGGHGVVLTVVDGVAVFGHGNYSP